MNFILLAIATLFTLHQAVVSMVQCICHQPMDDPKKICSQSSLLKFTTNFVTHIKMQISHFLDKLAETLFAE